jgi:hypothetical protein
MNRQDAKGAKTKKRNWGQTPEFRCFSVFYFFLSLSFLGVLGVLAVYLVSGSYSHSLGAVARISRTSIGLLPGLPPGPGAAEARAAIW